MIFYHADQAGEQQTRIIFLPEQKVHQSIGLTDAEARFVQDFWTKEKRIVSVNRYDFWIILYTPDLKKTASRLLESIRLDGVEICSILNQNHEEEIIIEDFSGNPLWIGALSEGIALSNYQFTKYFTDAVKKQNWLKRIGLLGLDPLMISELNAQVESVYIARDLVNEPVSFLNAPKLSEEIVRLSYKTGIRTEVYGKDEIESMKMGGLLAVNRGSLDPPRFIVMHWEPEASITNKPLVLVGKGIVYDTGGLSLKPTPNSMDEMKSDMAGAAAVIGTIYALARMNWPVKVLGLIPATDNRPDGNAYAPGDVITMFDGTTVEVLNTDAEGRLILADALSYARKFEPSLVIDLATLTGSAQMCLGSQATALMADAPENMISELMCSGDDVYERLVRLPLYEEYDKMLESDIADVKNIGGKMAGAITAGKFLQRFTGYPWIHLDIAGTAFLTSRENYRGIGGTGVGIRLLLNFIRRFYLQNKK